MNSNPDEMTIAKNRPRRILLPQNMRATSTMKNNTRHKLAHEISNVFLSMPVIRDLATDTI